MIPPFPTVILLHWGSHHIPALTGHSLSLSSLVQLEKAVLWLCSHCLSDRCGPPSAEHFVGWWRAVPLQLDCVSVSQKAYWKSRF